MKNILFCISYIYFITINLGSNIYSDECIRRVLLMITSLIIAYILRLYTWINNLLKSKIIKVYSLNLLKFQ